MAGDFPFDVFLYYSAPDRATVRALAEQLRDDGVRVWFDEWQIGPGDDRAAKITAGLGQARLLVFCLSAHTIDVEWSQVEQVTLPFRDPQAPERRFLPLHLDNSPLPTAFAQFLPMDWRGNDRTQDYNNLLVACRTTPPADQPPANQQTVATKSRSLGHTDYVRSVAWSPDGQYLLSGADDTTVRTWEAASGRCLTVLEGHTAPVLSVAWSPDSQHLLSGARDKTLRVWEVASGRCLAVLHGHTAAVLSVAWSPDSQHLLSGADDTTVRVWEVASGDCLTVLQGHTGGVGSVAWSPDGQYLLSGAGDKTLQVWEVASGRCLAVLHGHTAAVWGVAWSPDGQHLLSGSADTTVRVWEVASGRCLTVLHGHTGTVRSVAWSLDSQHLLSGSADTTVRVWEVASGRCLTVLEGHTDYVRSVAWSPDSQHLLSGADDKTVRVWEAASGGCLTILEGHTDYIRSVAWSPDGQYLLSGSADTTMRVWEAASGRCLTVLEGHTDYVRSVAWSPDAQYLLSGAKDTTVRVWEAASGRSLTVLQGHTDYVLSVAWSPDGQYLLSGAGDKTLRVWKMASGDCLTVLQGHTGGVESVAWSPDGQYLLSGAGDKTLRVWEVASGRCLAVLQGHTAAVESVVWSPDGQHLLSGADDTTVRVWEVASGRCLAVLEGHTAAVFSVGWSPDGQHLLSGGADETVRVWEVASGRCLTVLEGHTAPVWSVTWSPDGQQPRSAAVNGVVRFWTWAGFMQSQTVSPEPAAAHSEANLPPVRYTNAKVLLVGDTGVGKSGLAERLVAGRFVPTKSSHARKAEVLESETVTAVDGFARQQEIILWDLAGQPAYRLVHQLSLENAAVACVLFDNRHESNPFAVPSYWSQALDQSRGQHPLRKILVAARTDVGGLPASRERIESFMREHGFSGFIATSAFTGDGCDELRAIIRQAIAWDELPWLSTTQTLAALRTYVAKLKERLPAKEDRRLAQSHLFPIAALHEGFAAYSGEKLPLADFIAHLQRLEATDALDLLVFHTMGAQPQPEDLVLLDPTRVDAYASALLIAARDEPDGPGHLLETDIRQGLFKLDSSERLDDPLAERHLLWFVVENLLARDLALREQIEGEDYLVFPSQCTAELTFPGAAAFGVAYSFAGSVRSIYATLIAQLAHFEGFQSREFYLDAAAYRAEQGGGRCLIRLHDTGHGQGEVEISFEAAVPPAMRQGFLEFVGKHLEAKSNLNSVNRRHAYHCQHCSKPFDDQVVKARLADKRNDLLCPYCEKKTPLHDLLVAPNAAAVAVAQHIERDAKVGRQRMTAANVIKYKESEGKYDVFLSHNSKDKAAVEQIAKQLKAVGIRPWLDKWDLAPGDTLLDALERAIKTIPCAALCFGPADVGRWHILEIRAYIERWASGDARLIPLILPGVDKTPDLPMFVRQTLWVDMRQWQSEESDGFYRLVCGILGRAPGDAPLRKFGVRNIAEWQGLDF